MQKNAKFHFLIHLQSWFGYGKGSSRFRHSVRPG